MATVLVTGGTGFIGGRLVEALVGRGDRVTVLSRRPRPSSERLRYVAWDPQVIGTFAEVVSGQDAVVHLAGERVVGVRYTEALKRRAWESRVGSTEKLVEALRRAPMRPRVFVCCSAVGYYGCRHDSQRIDESAPAGTDFLARLCVAWEEAARAAEALSVRVVRARMGIALGEGGALAQMALPFRFFAGGPIGEGTQGVSWIHLDDAVAALLFMIDRRELDGPINVTSPNPSSNAELGQAIGAVLGRPSALRVPSAALRLVFGEGAEPILSGQYALPARLAGAGFAFRYPELEGAVRAALGRDTV